LEHDIFLNPIVFTDEAEFHISGSINSITVSFGAVSLPENIQNMDGIVLK
jgi:hypothetical protein